MAYQIYIVNRELDAQREKVVLIEAQRENLNMMLINENANCLKRMEEMISWYERLTGNVQRTNDESSRYARSLDNALSKQDSIAIRLEKLEILMK